MGKYTKLIKAGVITPEEAQKEMADTYNTKVPRFSANWARITPTKKDEWETGMETLLGIDVDPSYADDYAKGVSRVGENFKKFVEGKGEAIVTGMKEKLKRAVAG